MPKWYYGDLDRGVKPGMTGNELLHGLLAITHKKSIASTEAIHILLFLT